MTAALSFDLLLPWPFIAVTAAAALGLLAAAALRKGRGVIPRGVALAALVLALLNPRVVREERTPQGDVAVVVIDRSDSQRAGARQAQSEAALEAVRLALSRFKDLEVREVSADAGAPNGEDGGTRLFAAFAQAAAGLPGDRFAGAVLITDGQVHDLPHGPLPGPVHVLLSGKRGESDRRLVIEKAPGYGLTGREATIVYRIEDNQSRTGKQTARVRLSIDGKPTAAVEVAVGVNESFTFPIEHAGRTVIELEAEPRRGELSTLNNRGAVTVNGVRDRLRVLLVSGRPHPGERAWRNLLKSDPAIDLIHFTILRPPEKADFTQLKDLSLIVFPIKELFETKIAEFDLIVFDRYSLLDALPAPYISNIGNYLRGGGALLVTSGPEFAGQDSLFKTALGETMPAAPTGRIMNRGFIPELTADGRRHPVTAALPPPPWGRWFRQVEAERRSGEVLMSGPGDNPLLVLDRVGKGRIAQTMSDHIWLWARGFENGGPYGELMRRIAHWLMKEPDLEEESLTAQVRNGRLGVERRSLSATAPELTVTAPSGAVRTLSLTDKGDGTATAETAVDETGLYRIDDGGRTALAVAGALNPLELADLRATADILTPLVKASGGGVAWIADGLPDFRRTRSGLDAAGRGWFGFRRNQSYLVAGMAQTSLLSGLPVLVLVLGSLAAAWWREGK